MHILSKILRSLSLTILSGGSAAIVFAAVALVKAATANGVPVAEAAAANAPIFIHFAKVAFGAAVVLAIAELMDFRRPAPKSKLDYFRYASELISIICVCVYTFAIVPPMERLLPDIKTVEDAHDQFRHLHEISRTVFGASILFAFISILIPAFKKEAKSSSKPADKGENQTANLS